MLPRIHMFFFMLNPLLPCLWFVLVSFNAHAQIAVSTAHPLATRAGIQILQQGGNAFDAAVAVSAALAVVEPAGSGLGGGGFWLLHRTSDGFEVMVDGREKAPLAANETMFQDDEGQVIAGLSKNGALSAAIPGLPAALVHISKTYGKLELKETLKPAIQYAENGFRIGERHRKLLKFRLETLKQFPESAGIFLENGDIPEESAVLVQTDLAKTLKSIAAVGHNGFYQGDVANSLIAAVKANAGIWTHADLEQYQIKERKPIYGEYKGVKVTSAALPSSGGIVLMQSLNVLSAYDLEQLDELNRKHLVIEAMRRAYHSRALYLGDEDFVDVPIERLIHPYYAAGLLSTLRFDQSSQSKEFSGDMIEPSAGKDTTHFSIMDEQGNRVAATLSINYPFGSGMVAAGTGVLLNDEMDDFVSKKAVMNGYGLVGGSANSIQPGKRMLSSMSPTFLEDENRIAILGTPGGSRIISMVLLGILDFVAGNSPHSWVSLPRYHHQFWPDVVQYEPNGLKAEIISGLKKLGHKMKPVSYRYGNMQAISFDKQTGLMEAATDPRGEGLALVK